MHGSRESIFFSFTSSIVSGELCRIKLKSERLAILNKLFTATQVKKGSQSSEIKDHVLKVFYMLQSTTL